MNFAVEVGSPGCWLRTDIEGDPGRTLVKASRTDFATSIEAQQAIETARATHPTQPRTYKIVQTDKA